MPVLCTPMVVGGHAAATNLIQPVPARIADKYPEAPTLQRVWLWLFFVELMT